LVPAFNGPIYEGIFTNIYSLFPSQERRNCYNSCFLARKCLIVAIRMCDLYLRILWSENTRNKLGLVIFRFRSIKNFFEIIPTDRVLN